MSALPEATLAVQGRAVPTRDVRALLAWLDEHQARLLFAQGQPEREITAGQQAAISRARAALAGRAAGVDQRGIIQPMPPEMRDYTRALRQNPHAQPYLDEGCTPALVDLWRICALQPKVYLGELAGRLATVDTDDVRCLAELTLPLASPPPVNPFFDQQQQAFITRVGDMNLRVVGAFAGPAPDAPAGTVNIGFQVRAVSSFVHVVRVNGRYVLRDGYHRCLGLVRRGVRYAPVFVRETISLHELAKPGMLPAEVFLGDRPPVLPDYWDDGVSCAATYPRPGKAIVVQVTEVPIDW